MESIFLFGGLVPAKTRVQPNAFTLACLAKNITPVLVR
jgi:hypothetical protein